VNSHEQHALRILAALEASEGVSQRALARELDIALGLTNRLIRRLARRGWVRMVRVAPNRVQYRLTPAGAVQQARLARRSLHDSLRVYAEAKDRIRARLAVLSREWPPADDGRLAPEKRIVFFGAGEVAEVGFVCLKGTDLRLVAVVDDEVRAFFDVPVFEPRELRPREVGGLPYERLVVTSCAHESRIRRQLQACQVPADRVFWV
jgi:DNA-binding MarR family transcriptional regulator